MNKSLKVGDFVIFAPKSPTAPEFWNKIAYVVSIHKKFHSKYVLNLFDGRKGVTAGTSQTFIRIGRNSKLVKLIIC